MFKRLIAALILTLALTGSAHAACGTPFSIFVEQGTITGHPGEFALIDFEVANNDDASCPPRQFCIKAWNEAGTPGRPWPNFVSVSPPPPGSCQMLGGLQAALGWVFVDTTENTPPFNYRIITKIGVDNGGGTFYTNVNVLDPWGNTCQTQ